MQQDGEIPLDWDLEDYQAFVASLIKEDEVQM